VTTQQLAQEAIDAMGGQQVRGIQSFVMRGGTGSRTRTGQLARAGEPDPPAKLANVVETFDLANGRAALDYEIQAASGFAQHRQEVLTKRGDRAIGLENVQGRPLAIMSPAALFSWGTQNSPVMALRRTVVGVLRGAADAPASEPAQDKALDGRTLKYGSATIDGETVGLYFDPDTKLLAAFETTDTETMLGDVMAEYRLDDYRDVGGVRLPHKITIRKGGEPYADVQFAGAAVNDEQSLGVFAVPAASEAEADRVAGLGPDYSPLQLVPVADGVHFVQAYSHNSLVVEFPSFLALVEAPYTEAQSLTLARTLSETFPGKPLRYAAVTHPHFDHTGGVRGIAAQGATIVAARGHESQLRGLLDAPHTAPADALATRRRSAPQTGAALDVFDGKKVIAEGGQSLELYAITGSPHVEPMVIAYVPGPRLVFNSDLFFPGTGGGSSPAAAHLLQSIRALKLQPAKHAGGHGGVADFSELVKAVGAAGTSQGLRP
jgi:glyoxylase-like metal-dependent hydrolase (beta-lactamase superfamily II)